MLKLYADLAEELARSRAFTENVIRAVRRLEGVPDSGRERELDVTATMLAEAERHARNSMRALRKGAGK